MHNAIGSCKHRIKVSEIWVGNKVQNPTQISTMHEKKLSLIILLSHQSSSLAVSRLNLHTKILYIAFAIFSRVHMF